MRVFSTAFRFRYFSALDLYRKTLIVTILMSMLTVSTPAAPDTVKDFAITSWQDARFAYFSGGFDKLGQNVLALFTATRSSKDRPISRIRIAPGSVTVPTNVEAVFTATLSIVTMSRSAESNFDGRLGMQRRKKSSLFLSIRHLSRREREHLS